MAFKVKSSPCHGCPDRHELCHADCPRYAAYQADHVVNYHASATKPNRNDHERLPSKFAVAARKNVNA